MMPVSPALSGNTVIISGPRLVRTPEIGSGLGGRIAVNLPYPADPVCFGRVYENPYHIFMIFQHMIRGSSHDHTASVSGNLLDNFMLRGYRKAYYLRTQIKVVKNPGRIFVEV